MVRELMVGGLTISSARLTATETQISKELYTYKENMMNDSTDHKSQHIHPIEGLQISVDNLDLLVTGKDIN